MAIPAGVICGWPSTVASIPAGWSRVTALDAKYIRAIPNDETNPGSSGGAASHTHSTPGHVHSLNHSHGSATSANSSSTGGGGDSEISIAAGVHNHTFALGSASVDSLSASPGMNSVGNNPAHLEIIWIESDGSSDEFPEGSLLLCAYEDVPAGSTIYTSGDGLFLRGAPTSEDGGSIEPGTLESHSHDVAAHTHTGASHTHSNVTSSGNNANNSVENGAGGSAYAAANHTHTVTPTSASTGDLSSAGGGTTGEQSPVPPYIDLLVLESEGTAPELGMIAMWLGSLESIPELWVLCNGENETPNLCGGLFPRGASEPGNVLDTGGSSSHSHDDPGNHSHAIGSHNHATTWGTTTTITRNVGSGAKTRTTQHSTVHNANSAAATPTVSSVSAGTVSTESHIPEYVEVAFIMYLPGDIAIDVDSGTLTFVPRPPDIGFIFQAVPGAFNFYGQESIVKITMFMNVEAGSLLFDSSGIEVGFLRPWLVRLTPEPFSEVLLRVRIRGE